MNNPPPSYPTHPPTLKKEDNTDKSKYLFDKYTSHRNLKQETDIFQNRKI